MNTIDRSGLELLLKEANIKPRIRRELRFVPEEVMNWEARDFLAVTNRSRSEGVLIAPLQRLYVTPFHLQQRAAGKTGRVEPIICDFCATWQRGSNSAVITFERAASTVSFLCCGDLLCSFHVRDMTSVSKLSRAQLRENNSLDGRVDRLRRKLEHLLAGLA